MPERAGLDPVHTRDVHYDYNHALGLQTKARFGNLDGHGVTQYYDAFGQPTTVLLNMDGNARYTSYHHDDAGNLVRLTHPDGLEFGYAYDALGRMTAVHDKAVPASLDDLILRYGYKPEGPRHAAVRGAGSAGFTTVYYYDALQRPVLLANDLPGTASDLNLELAYNAAGQIVSRSLSNDSYAAPPAANVSRGYQVNGLNQYTGTTWAGAPNWSYEYDPNGNLKRAVDPVGTGTAAYLYDVENRLVSASGAVNAALVYDPLGRLFQVTSGTGAVTRFLYDGDRLIAEYDGTGTQKKRYVHGPGADEPVAAYDDEEVGIANRRYMLPDERGSVAALVNANGTPVAINRYDAWGMPPLDPFGPLNAGRFQYTGQAWIAELGLYYYKARLYSPGLGRFMQTDPIGYEDQMNLYAYVGNDPINSVDPSGLADVSYMNKYDRDYDRALGRDFDIAGTVTVLAHGSPISERRSDGNWNRPTSSNIAAAINSVSRSQPIFFGVCSLASSEGRRQIQEISRLTGNRPIMASTSYIYWTGHRDGSTTLRAFHPRADGSPNERLPGEFKVFNGSFANFGVNVPQGFSVIGIDVNKDGLVTGVTTRGVGIGSRLPVTRHEKVDTDK